MAKSSYILILIAEKQFGLGDKAGARRSFEAAAHAMLAGDPVNTRLSAEERAVSRLVGVMLNSRTYGDKEVKLDVLADAIRQTKRMQHSQLIWGFLHRFAIEYAALGEIATAKTLAQSIPVKLSGIKDAVYKEIVTEQLKLHDVDGARESLRLVKDSTNKAQLLVEFAIAEARNGDFTKATSAALKMFNSGEKVESLVAVAKAHLDNGRSNLACDTLSTAGKVAGALPENRGRQGALFRIAYVAIDIIKSGASDQGHGMQMASQMRSQQRDVVIWRICDALVDAKKLTEAKDILLEGRLGTSSTSVARSIAKAEVASQEKPFLPEWVAQLSNRSERLSAYLGCADALIEKEMGK